MYNATVTDDVNYIFHVFNNISMIDFASLLGINRCSAHSYLEFSKCSNQSAKLNLERLVQIAQLFEQANIERLDSFMHREIVDGKTLFEIIQDNICNPIIDLDKVISIVKEISNKEAAIRKESKSCSNNLRSLEEIMSEHSTPISYD